MICTNTDHHVNTLSTVKKEKKKKDMEFYKNSQRLKAANYFLKTPS